MEKCDNNLKTQKYWSSVILHYKLFSFMVYNKQLGSIQNINRYSFLCCRFFVKDTLFPFHLDQTPCKDLQNLPLT